ncbi:hypothetical protein PM082_000801 [Marasmius tenuissimus]|nr:hypothetical protein PM082_000801 [Marasmius tenuissimus]
MHGYGLDWETTEEPWIAVGYQTWALWVMMFINVIIGTETSYMRALLLPPVASFISMSSSLFFVYGTLEIWLLPFTDWKVVHRYSKDRYNPFRYIKEVWGHKLKRILGCDVEAGKTRFNPKYE